MVNRLGSNLIVMTISMSTAPKNIESSWVAQRLQGIENYVTWRKAMTRALPFKTKLGFVQGSYLKPDDPFELKRWEKCNNTVLTWNTISVLVKTGGTLIHAEDCKQAWLDLQTTYGGSKGPMMFGLLEKIASLKHGEIKRSLSFVWILDFEGYLVLASYFSFPWLRELLVVKFSVNKIS